MLFFYADNLFILSLRNLVFSLDYLSAMFSLLEFFGALVIVFIFLLFRFFFFNTLFLPTLPTLVSGTHPSPSLLVRASFIFSKPPTDPSNYCFYVFRAMRAFYTFV